MSKPRRRVRHSRNGSILSRCPEVSNPNGISPHWPERPAEASNQRRPDPCKHPSESILGGYRDDTSDIGKNARCVPVSPRSPIPAIISGFGPRLCGPGLPELGHIPQCGPGRTAFSEAGHGTLAAGGSRGSPWPSSLGPVSHASRGASTDLRNPRRAASGLAAPRAPQGYRYAGSDRS